MNNYDYFMRFADFIKTSLYILEVFIYILYISYALDSVCVTERSK